VKRSLGKKMDKAKENALLVPEKLEMITQQELYNTK
jgi:hypothetical protein